MEEMTFLSDSGVTVTNARFIVPSQTYPIRSITSVKFRREDPSLSEPVFLIGVVLVGIGIAASGLIAQGPLQQSILRVLVGSGIAVLGGLALSRLHSVYSVVLITASGEAQALKSADQDYIARVVAALNEAIVSQA